ncbi:MAG: NYN domain-containing protein [Flavobacteriales bacterium]|nr:NYN domain-containing protein [Flavobacteriales bacterium]
MKEEKLAVLIDAENVPHANTKEMLQEIAKHGTPTIKRIYADWTDKHVSRWKPVLLENAITPIQQYSYTKGKNSSDSAMIIDAMDILYSEKVDGFCIVSSDSDFTRLAIRLREAGKTVLGFGEQKTPKPFITACDKFIYLEILKPKVKTTKAVKNETTESTKDKTAALNAIDKELINLIKTSISDLSDESGWAHLGGIGNNILKKKPDFDSRNYGSPKLSSLIKNIDRFIIEEKDAGGKRGKQFYIKNK